MDEYDNTSDNTFKTTTYYLRQDHLCFEKVLKNKRIHRPINKVYKFKVRRKKM